MKIQIIWRIYRAYLLTRGRFVEAAGWFCLLLAERFGIHIHWLARLIVAEAKWMEKHPVWMMAIREQRLRELRGKQ
jgi:hypothetical protein